MISDLLELELCSNLEKLDLSFNKIENEENLYFLSNLFNLKWLSLIENPIYFNTKYKYMIEEFLPNLESIDKEISNIENSIPEIIKEEVFENKNQIEEPNENHNTMNKDEAAFKNKSLKPVVIKRACDIHNVFRMEDRRLADQINSNLDKNTKGNMKIKNQIHKS
jgi:hypothetical protein